MLDKIFLAWLTHVEPVLAQFAPSAQETKFEISPGAKEILPGLPGTAGVGNKTGFQVIADTIATITGYLIGLLGFLAVLMLIYAGFLWVTAAAKPDNIQKAKTLIFYVVVGLLLAGFAYAIVTVVTGIAY